VLNDRKSEFRFSSWYKMNELQTQLAENSL